MSKVIVAMLCITALAVTAMVMGVNGASLATACTMLAGLGGFSIGKTISQKPKG